MTAPQASDSARQVLDGARAEAVRLGQEFVGAEHIVLGLLAAEPGARLFRELGLDPALVRERVEAGSRRARSRSGGGEMAYTTHAKRLIDIATREARERGTPLTAELLLLGALEQPRGALARILADGNVTVTDALSAARRAAAPATDAHLGGASPMSAPESGAGGWGPLWRKLLLLAVPAAMVLSYLHAPPVLVFIASALGVLPLAGFMGEATEHLAQKTGPTIGGLLNATFGNAAELIIAIVALRAGLVELVKASITGSILGNLLLILGLSLIAGGTKQTELRFNRTTAGMSSAMLALAVVGLVFPALFHSLHPEQSAALAELRISELVSGILIVTYAFSLLFTLKTHRRLFGGEPHPLEGPTWSVTKATIVLAVATVGVAFMSEILVHATEAVTATLGLSEMFLGLIIIPIIGNAAEHAAAVVVARKGQTDLALQIALGSSTQIALLVAPLLVFVGLVLGQNMNLVFSTFEVAALGLATLVAAILTLDGESHWFEGVQLLAVYGMVAVAAFFI